MHEHRGRSVLLYVRIEHTEQEFPAVAKTAYLIHFSDGIQDVQSLIAVDSLEIVMIQGEFLSMHALGVFEKVIDDATEITKVDNGIFEHELLVARAMEVDWIKYDQMR